jgi:ATP-dependent RNA helicase MSS116
LFTTDVSARGVDYPGVTLVLQVGIPKTRDDYIHRIGRTGRANKSGEAILMLSPYEVGFLRNIKDLPIKADARHSAAASASKPEVVAAIKTAMNKFSEEDRRTIFTAWCGGAKETVGKYYQGPYQKAAEDFAINILGFKSLPSMSPMLAAKLGLSAGGGGSRSGGGSRGGAFGSGMFGRDRSPSLSSGGYGQRSDRGGGSYGGSSGYGGSSSGYNNDSRGSGGFRSERGGGYGNDRSDRGGGYGNGRGDRGKSSSGLLSDFMKLREKLNNK